MQLRLWAGLCALAILIRGITVRTVSCVLLGVTVLAVSGCATRVRLSVEGTSDYVIVVGDDAIAPERTAATELQSHLEAVTGVRLPIQSEQEAVSGTKRIVVGPCATFRQAFPDIDLDSLGHDGIVMKSRGDTVYLAGGRPRGTLYAVYTFLEDVAGCRWWTPTENSMPVRPILRIPRLDTVYVPNIKYREAFYRGAFDGKFSVRNKCNGHHHRISPEYGGHYTILGWCHTFYRLLPPEKHFAEHPEWYSELDGKRVAQRAQLCLTNTEMRAEFVKNALEWIRQDPGAGIISISQNDCHGACQCADCRALEEREGSPSGPLIHFVNAVAEEIEKEFPEFWVETLAYTYTRKAPKHVRPRENVVVRLCSIECSFSQPLGTGPQNRTFKRDIEAWSAIAHHLYIWDYVTNFSSYILPHPNLRVLAPNIRLFEQHKAIGLFEQGDSQCSCSDFPELRAWLIGHLMWDPSRDETALIDEFLDGYYGAASPPLRDYIQLIHDAVEDSGRSLRCYMNDTSSWLDPGGLERATALFDDAERRVADDPVLATRVRRARMPLDHVWLNRYHALKRTAKAENRPFTGPADPMAFAEGFIERAHAFDVGSWREGRPFTEHEPALRARFGPPGTVPQECAGVEEDDWCDVQEFEFRLAGLGTWVTVVKDETASNGMAARMPGNHTQWAVQWPVSSDVSSLGPLRCYVTVRCEAKSGTGPAFDLGIYDMDGKRDVARKRVNVEDAGDGRYHTYDLGLHTLEPTTTYFWVAPVDDPERIEAILVDRIFCVRER